MAASGNGDDRAIAIWERIEAKIDRLGEGQAALEGRAGGVEDRLLMLMERVDLVVRAQEATRKSFELKLDLARIELLDAMHDVARGHAVGVRTLVEGQLGRLDELAIRVEVLERERS